MIARERSRSFKAFLGLVAISIFLSLTCGGVAHAKTGYLNSSIAGTYLAVTADDGKIMQINADGNITLILSEQFLGGGVLGESYSNGLGSWKWIGMRKITAEVVDVSYKDGAYVGVGAYKAIIKFSHDFKTAYLTCEGGLYAPGVDPFAPDAVPLVDFDCGKTEYQRISP